MQVEPFLIEPQRARDRSRVIELLQQAQLLDHDLHVGQAPVDFLVMREARQVVGAIGLQNAGGAGLLRSLVVAPSLHRQGRGAALVAAAERLATRRGIDDLFLLTTDVAGFFALLDYLRIERASAPPAIQQTAQFSSLCPASAVCMHKRLRK
ncbi:MAG TPA: arsenic resistance N-acetyltransferase ArsN2 [Burkholderiaceae bacterium]|nr:arsenic resistance N-acetyltransferase ArsN2 [Burkholderiaceae bacterium]